MSIQHVTADTPAASLAAILQTDGAVIIDNLAPESLIDGVVEEMQPHIDATSAGPDGFSGRNTRRTGGLIARSPASHELIMNPTVTDVASALMHQAKTFQLHLTQIIAIGGHEPAQPVHRDQWAFDFFPFPADYHVQCNTMWALTDFTEANGATRVIPGSVALEDSFEMSHDDTVPAEMSKGSVLLYTGKVYHSGGANTTGETRLGGNITYCVSWVRQEENQYLSCPPEITAELPEDLLRMMGYARGAYALGYVDDLRDPIEVVRPDLARHGFGDQPVEAELQS